MIYVIGDIHGCYLALIELLNRVNFNYKEDILIVLGDVFDGWDDVFECVELLMKIDNLIYVKGNHDEYTISFLHRYIFDGIDSFTNKEKKKCLKWLRVGGQATVDSYLSNNNLHYIDRHIKFISNMPNYYIDDNNNLFIHAGYWDVIPNKDSNLDSFFFKFGSKYVYDNVLYNSKFIKDENFNHVYLGHTSTQEFGESGVVTIKNVTFMDAGISRMGHLAIKNLSSGEIILSEKTGWEYYPDSIGRNSISFNEYGKI